MKNNLTLDYGIRRCVLEHFKDTSLKYGLATYKLLHQYLYNTCNTYNI